MNENSVLEVRSLGEGSLPCGSVALPMKGILWRLSQIRRVNESGALGRYWWKDRSGRSPEGLCH